MIFVIVFFFALLILINVPFVLHGSMINVAAIVFIAYMAGMTVKEELDK